MRTPQLPLFPIPEISNRFEGDSRVVLALEDAKSFASSIPNDTIDLIITSPPYNIGKSYETRTSLQSYLKQQDEIISHLIRVLRPGGSICWQVGNYVADGEVFPLDIYYYDIFKEHGMKLRNRIIWHFGHGLHATKRFSGRYETLLWFSKADTYKFNLDSVRVPSKYPGKRHYKGQKKGKLSGNPLGKNPSDIWEFIAQEWDKELWNIPNVKSNHPEKTIHPCQFPIELVERCVLAFTDEDDSVFDPFCGVGSTLIGALRHNRRAFGCDQEAEYIQIARQRIEDFYHGRLKIRPIGKPVHKPSGREKVAQMPSEWEDKDNR